VRQLSSVQTRNFSLWRPRGRRACRQRGDPRSVDEADWHARRGDIQALIAERLPLLPALGLRLQEVPLGLDYPCWVDDGGFDLVDAEVVGDEVHV
jgi:hypothetical protein